MIQNHCLNRSGKQGLKRIYQRKRIANQTMNHMDWHLVENIFCRLKQFRGIATQYDKLKRNYQSSVALACIFLWLPL
jgi:transposase